MARRLGMDVGGIAYHVLNRRVARMTIFETGEDYAAFGKVLDEAYQPEKGMGGAARTATAPMPGDLPSGGPLFRLSSC